MGTRGYQVACLNYVLDGWWKDRRFSEVEKVLDRVQELVSSRETSIVFRRVYIPKGSDSWRPLGVPTLAFRVYLHMLNNFVV
jgi:retron-type reverse transcriptase